MQCVLHRGPYGLLVRHVTFCESGLSAGSLDLADGLLESARGAPGNYPEGLHVVTKVGARRGDDGSWIPSLTPESLIQQVHENLGHLGLEALDVVNLRVGGPETPGGDSLAEPFSALAELQRQASSVIWASAASPGARGTVSLWSAPDARLSR